MKHLENMNFDEERALYNSNMLVLTNCNFQGKADGESALKECINIFVDNCNFLLRYPFWHNKHVKIDMSYFSNTCRAAIWYSDDITISNSKLLGIKAIRECNNVTLNNCFIDSTEFGWFSNYIKMIDSDVVSEYFMMKSANLDFKNVLLKGKYSFQYIENSIFEDCNFDTKDAFWHAKNVAIKNSIIKGEYLAWYCDNVTFINCKIIGTQPFCYCKNLKLINCEMINTDLAFEKSEVQATITSIVDSIKNPKSGSIEAYKINKIILDDNSANCVIKETNNCK